MARGSFFEKEDKGSGKSVCREVHYGLDRERGGQIEINHIFTE